MPEADHLDLSHPTGAATEVDSRSYDDLAAEAKAYTWTEPEPARQADPRLHPDPRPTSVQLRETRAELATAETQRDLAQADADRHLRNARYLGGLLEQFARTLGANPPDLEELPALVDGLRTTTDQLRIKAADHAHALDRAEAGATFWKTHLVRESNQLRDHLTKARAATAEAESQAGAHRLAYDHLAAVTRRLIDRIIGPIDGAAIAADLDAVRDALSRDLDSYLSNPDETPAPCQLGCGIGYHLRGCRHIGLQLGISSPQAVETDDEITPETRVGLTPAGLAVASVPPVARESGRLAAQGEAVNATDQVLCDVADEREAQDGKWGVQNHPDGTSRLLAGMADDVRRDAQHAASQGRLTWSHILTEEFWEAVSEEDPARLRVELVQVAAVAVAWAEAIDRRAVEVADRG